MKKETWIDNIPEGWEIVPLKSRFSFDKGLSITKADLVEKGLPVLSYGQIHSKSNPGTKIVNDLLRYVPEEIAMSSPDSLAEPNGFVFADTSEDLEGCGNCSYIDRTGIYGGYHTIVLKPNSEYKTDNRYLAYLFQTDAWRYQIRRKLTEVKVFSISQKALKETGILVPSVEEQQAIVAFLDSKCAAIDEAIERHKKAIEGLKKYKKSITNKVISHGIRNTAKRIVNIEWIQDIPENWEVKRLKYVMENYDYQRKPVDASLRSQEGDVLYDYYGASGIIDKIDGYTTEGEKILIGEDGANLVLRNLPLIYIGKGKYWVNNHAHILAPKNGNLYYFAYQMECIDYMKYITGSAQPKLSQSKLNEVPLVVPPIDEQNEIADYLQLIWSKIDASTIKHEDIITRLQEYRKSLIYHAVTGKIDCRGADVS